MRWRRIAALVAAVLPVAAGGCSLLVETGDLAGNGNPLVPGDAGTEGAVGPDAPAADAPPTDAPPTDAPPTDAPPTDAYGAAVIADAPIAYFRFEETSGTACKNEVAPSSVVCVLPTSGVTRGSEGISAGHKAIGFDNLNATVTVFGATSFTGSQPFTIEAWYQMAGPANGQRLFNNMDNGGTATRTGQWSFLLQGGPFDGMVQTEAYNAGVHLFYTRSNTRFPVDAWAHVVFLHSNVLDKDILYVNTVESAGGRLAGGTRAAATSPLSFQGFQGRLDEVAIYATVLSPARIAAHYSAR